MIHDKIALTLQDIAKLREKLQAIKKDIKIEEKINNDQYIELERAMKDLKVQVKTFKDSYLEELKSDDQYNKLREMRLKAEEDVANLNAKLFEFVSQLPQKDVQMDVAIGEMSVKVQIMPDMRVYLNGKEEKKRV